MPNISIKIPKQIQAMREGGKILAEILNYLKEKVEPGMSTLDLENLSQEKFKEFNVIPSFQGYHGFPASICASVNDEVVHGIPSANKIIQQGDLVKIDCGVYHKGLHTDSAITVIVGEVSHELENLVSSTYAALDEGIKNALAENTIGDISNAIQKILEENNLGVVRECTGHGIGENIHEPPTVENYGERNTGPVLKPGMTIAIEPISTLGDWHIYEKEDRWTLATKDKSFSAHAEHTILITEDSPEILTKL